MSGFDVVGAVLFVVMLAMLLAVRWTLRRMGRLRVELRALMDDVYTQMAGEDMIYGRGFVDACRYASAVIVVGVDPDRPGRARVRSFQREQIGGDLFREPLEPCDIADCLRVHADDLEAGVA